MPTCIGEDYRDTKNVLHRNVIVHAIYKVRYMVKEVFIKDNTVPIDFDDGSCKVNTFSVLLFSLMIATQGLKSVCQVV